MPFTTSRKLRFGQCDPAGIAYFPNYLDILCDVLEEFFEALGEPWTRLVGQQGLGMPTVKLDLDFVAPATHGDRLDFTLFVRKVGQSSMVLDHVVAVDGRTVWTAHQVIVAMDLAAKAKVSLPDRLRQELLARLEPDHV